MENKEKVISTTVIIGNNKGSFISYAIVVILLCVIAYLIFIDKPKYIDEFKEKIENLEVKNDSVGKLNDSLDLQIEYKDSQILLINDSLKGKDGEIYNLKLRTNEKINNVDSFNNVELQQFFSDRYNESNIKKRDSTINN